MATNLIEISVEIKVRYILPNLDKMAQFLRSRMNMENDWCDFIDVLKEYTQEAFDEGREFQKEYKNL